MTFKNSSARNRTIDLVRSAAIWNVVLSHVAAAPFSGGTVGTGQWLSALFWASLTHSSVSLFLMASGALLLPPEQELTVRKIYTRYIPRWGIVTPWFFSLRYALAESVSVMPMLRPVRRRVQHSRSSNIRTPVRLQIHKLDC